MGNPRNNTMDIFLLLIIIALPSSFQLTPPSIPIGDFYVTLVELCIFIFLCHWLCDLLVSGKGYRSLLDGWFLLLVSYLCLSCLLGVSRYGAIKAFGDFRQFLPLFLYFGAMRFFSHDLKIARVRWRIFDVMIIVAIYVLLVFLLFRDSLAIEERMAERVFFDNTMLPLMIYSGYLFSCSFLERARNTYIFSLLGLNTMMLLIMQVRTYWVAFAVIIGSTLLTQYKSIFRTRIVVKIFFIVVTTGLAAILLVNIVPTGTNGFEGVLTSIIGRVESLINLEETIYGWNSQGSSSDIETIGSRMVTAQVVWNDYIKEMPLFGTGFGGELPMVSRLGGVVLMKYSIDNGYLTILAKFGVIGFTLYGLIIWRISLYLFRITRSHFAINDEKMLAYSFLVGIFVMLIASFSTSNFIRQPPSLVAFIFMIAETEVMMRNVEARRRESLIHAKV